MDLPSMVQRSGDTLIVRSVVSGNQLYMDQTNSSKNNNNNNNNHNINNNNNNNAGNSSLHSLSPAAQQHQNNMLEQQLERYRAAAAAVQRTEKYLQQNSISQQQQQQQQQHGDGSNQPMVTLEPKEEGLPQCKIKRNYSCSYCTYFTQNPRYHLTHLRDVHGEKIVINKCELCLYASRHFQKLVRHMKMVHGCTDGIPGTHGQSRGKRGMSREARKRKLEQSVGLGVGGNRNANIASEMPTIEQVKRELQLQEQKLQALAKQQEEQKQQQQLANSAAEALIAAAYGRQLQVQRERDLEALQAAAARATLYDRDGASDSQQRQSSSPGFQMPPFHPLRVSSTPNRNIELSPSPTGSTSPTTTTTYNQASPSGTHGDGEHPQNRLLKCSVCDFTTLYREQLIDHELEEHCKTKFFRCEKCSYVTHIKTRFSKHVKYHSMPMIKCVACDFRTPYKWNLDRHMKNHGGTGPFKCAACDFTADIKQSLTVHEMNHHVPPVGHAAGMSLARRRNKVGGTDLSDDFLSDSADMLEDHFNNNNLDEYDDNLVIIEDKKGRYTDEEPTDLSQKGGSSDTSSVHNQSGTPKAKRPVPNLIPIIKSNTSVLNLSKNLTASRSSLTDIASMYFNDKQLNELLQPFDKPEAAQLSPTTTIASTSSQNSRSLFQRRAASVAGSSFFDQLKSSALAGGGPNENLICPCGHVAKCLSESIIHRKTCNIASLAVDDDLDEEPDDTDGGRLEIDFVDDDDKQSHSALNLSVTGSTRCQHCRHRCKTSADLLAHMKHCPDIVRFGNESYDSMSGESNTGRGMNEQIHESSHPMENRVFVWNKPRSTDESANGKATETIGAGSSGNNPSNDENSYYGVETAPGYGEVTKKMTPEEEAANSSLKKVYKCPHCSFWASTASRFHVHIVGHLNKKPFECSLCSYRSNWRWDITKHIRLKTIRDPSHKNARVLMNDETGRRNYTKYNKYITLMKVTEEDGDPKLMKSGEMTPHQVASLAFFNDVNKGGNNAGTSGTSNGLLPVQLNGLKEDITLEPLITVKTGEGQLNDDFIRLPLLATMVNAAMAQQQHQQQNDESQQHRLTPSVTISAVKRTPSALTKASDDLIIDVSQEGNEKKTYYNCRKCSFRHSNRDAALAHVKIHYQDPNYPIVTATPMSTLKAVNSQNKQHATPLQVAVNQTNMYMNKVLAAMGFPQPGSSTSNSQQAQHSFPAGLLQQAIQGVAAAAASSPNSPLSGLALALAGKSPTKLATAASILEHGEQKANLNEASAQNPSSSPKIGVIGSTVPPSSNSSLQYLLSSPRAAYSITSSSSNKDDNIHKNNHNNNNNNNNDNGVGIINSNNNNHNSNNNLVMGLKAETTSPHIGALHSTGDPTNASLAIVTTPSAITSSSSSSLNTISHSNSSNCKIGIIGIGTGTGNRTGGENVCIGGYGASSTSSFNSNNDNNIKNNSTLTRKINNNSSNSMNLSSKFLTNSNEHFSATKSPTTTTNKHTSRTSSQSPASMSMSASASASNASSNLNNLCNTSNNNNLLSLNSERRNPSVDPSPYRCGHCHQVSNWKHVIQRHCRLKHGGDMRIETLDRTASNNDREAPPIYRPLGNNNSNAHNNESNSTYAIAMKSLQQPLNNNNKSNNSINNNNNSNNNNNNNNNNNHNYNNNNISSNNNNSNVANSVLMSATEQLLHSSLTASAAAAAAAAANAASTQQDLNAAAAACLAAAYRVATSGVGSTTNTGDDLQLQHQLQQNDQIEITRLPASVSTQTGEIATSSLAQLLEGVNHAAMASPTNLNSQNSKSKQQKCPLCPYISESKSQMNYHISLHKPTQYECQLCPFVCAKKQHLSSHMRSVHHQYNLNSTNSATNGLASGNVAGTNNGSGTNLDFCVALQLAAATQNQQRDHSPKRNAHVVEMSPPLTTSQSDQKQELPAEYQYKLISYCAKCPARFAQKHNDSHNAKAELSEHLNSHGTPKEDISNIFQCEFCDYHAAHETLIQTHRHAHTPHYQEKYSELYKNCKEDAENPAPKLMQITLTKLTTNPKTIWIVDNELSNELFKEEQQETTVCNAKFDNANSLLKKQLEAGQAAMNDNAAPRSPTTSPKLPIQRQPPADCDESSNTLPSTSASIATSDLAADGGSDSHSNIASPAPLERCLHCPFETTNATLYKAHLTHHICISNKKEAYTCDHCDYSDTDKTLIAEHTRIHFNAMEKLKSVAFFTSYDNLELSIEQPDEDEQMENSSNEEIIQHIKQEHETINHNNNNEENVVNENTVQQQKEQKDKEEKDNIETMDDGLEPPPAKKTCNKIILYKNDGQISIKKDPTNSMGGDSISERLRRRISRNINSQANGYQQQRHDENQQQDASHKAILVNAKTGEVLKKN